MLRRISAWFLWVLPAFFLVFMYIYHAFGLRVHLEIGAIYLAAVALAVWQISVGAREIAEALPMIPAAVVLIAGGAIEWVTGSLGPPNFSDPAAAYINSAGLLTGWIVVLAGFAALTASMWHLPGREFSLAGLTGFALATALWTGERVVVWALLALHGSHPGTAPTNSELMTALSSARSSSAAIAVILAYASLAAFGAALWRNKQIGTIWPPIIEIFIGLYVVRLLVQVVTHAHLSRVPPAFVCFFPYMIGVALLRVRRSVKAVPSLSAT